MAKTGMDPRDNESLKQIFSAGLKQTAVLLSTILRSKIQLGLNSVQTVTLQDISAQYADQQLVLSFNNDVQGQGLICLPVPLAAVLCDILSGKDGKNPPQELAAQDMAACSQLLNQFLKSLSASISQSGNKKLSFSGGEAKIASVAQESQDVGQQAVVVAAKFVIEDLTEAQMSLILPIPMALEICAASDKGAGKAGSHVEALNLATLDKSGPVASGNISGILVDVPLQLSVELGRTKMILKDILELGVGSIVELDRLAGEPVDILLNNRVLAKGEVVVIDENLGIRLTHIINPNERT